MTYDEFVLTIARLCVVDSTDADLLAIIPQAVDAAEGRIYNDLDMLASRTRSASHLLAAGNRNITLLQGEFLTVDRISILTPAGATSPDAATRVPLIAATPEFIDLVYNSQSVSGQPAYWAIRDLTSIIVGPWPSGNYTTEISGTERPAAMSSTNTTTPISRDMPELLVNAAMVFMAGWMKNFGAQADDPKMAVSWEAQYQASLGGWRTQEARRRLEAAGWTSRPPAPALSAPRA